MLTCSGLRETVFTQPALGFACYIVDFLVEDGVEDFLCFLWCVVFLWGAVVELAVFFTFGEVVDLAAGAVVLAAALAELAVNRGAEKAMATASPRAVTRDLLVFMISFLLHKGLV